MKHRVAGRKLGRRSEHRTALLRNLSTELLDKERITTTLGKAKELRRFAEKLVTLSKRETLHARRQVLRHVRDRDVVAKLFDTLSARYAQRPGGYTRVIKLGPRRGDNAEMALVELVGSEDAARAAAPAKPAKAKARRAPKPAEGEAAAADEQPKKKAPRKAKAAKAKPAKAEGKKASTGAKSVRKSATAKKGSTRGS